MFMGSSSAHAGVAHGGQLRVGVLGAAHVVRPVVHGGDAGAQRLREPKPDAAIAVLGRHVHAKPRRDGEVAALADIAAHVRTQQTGPQVPVRVDEARHADDAAAVDDLCIVGIDRAADCDDHAVADAHVAWHEVAETGVHGQHGGAADDEGAARRQGRCGAGGRSEGRRDAALLGACCGCCGGHGAERGGPLEHATTADAASRHGATSRGPELLSLAVG
jgi:hypothetical protein